MELRAPTDAKASTPYPWVARDSRDPLERRSAKRQAALSTRPGPVSPQLAPCRCWTSCTLPCTPSSTACAAEPQKALPLASPAGRPSWAPARLSRSQRPHSRAILFRSASSGYRRTCTSMAPAAHRSSHRSTTCTLSVTHRCTPCWRGSSRALCLSLSVPSHTPPRRGLGIATPLYGVSGTLRNPQTTTTIKRRT
jgi:hypothetical protein